MASFTLTLDYRTADGSDVHHNPSDALYPTLEAAIAAIRAVAGPHQVKYAAVNEIPDRLVGPLQALKRDIGRYGREGFQEWMAEWMKFVPFITLHTLHPSTFVVVAVEHGAGD